MNRRDFVGMVATGFLLVPVAVCAQAAQKLRRLGFLSPDLGLTNADLQERMGPLRELGWIEGKNIVVERRVTSRNLLPAAAQELVRLKVELIIVDGTDATLAAKNATTTIPIVMEGAGDPVAMGIVASLARPGGNVTGYSMVSTEIAAKRAALVHELLPTAQRVALMTGGSRMSQLMSEASEAAYRSLGVTPVLIQGMVRDGVQRAPEEAARLGAQAFDALSVEPTDAAAFMATAMRYRLPVIVVGNREMLDAGALMSFQNNSDDQNRRVALIIDKILRGAKPADIPVEQPTKFELVINLKAAKALGITIPQSLLLRATDVIP